MLVFLCLHSSTLPSSLCLSPWVLVVPCARLAQEVQAENVTVAEGGQAEINCRLHQYDGSIVVIQNPSRQTLFFNGTRGEQTPEGRITGRGLHVGVVLWGYGVASVMFLTGCRCIVLSGELLFYLVLGVTLGEVCAVWMKESSFVGGGQVVVLYSPTVRIHPTPGVMREGDTLVLTCAVNGNPLPTEITWSRANDSLPERAQVEGEVLTIPMLSMLDNGTYSCQVANKHGRSSDQYVLVVYDPGSIVETQTSVPYAIVGGILALLVFLVICVLIVMVWCSIRQKGSYLTHEASGLDEHGEAREAFLNGGDGHKRKEEFFI
uniref:Cell adhesion molecule 4 n=2 Tax=Sphenodon punctatus TaxID=8508 RepID=A0A8D0LAK5_SPHPU